MELFLMTLTTGILVGGIYALVALGWVLIYKCSGVLNLAMGELTLIGAYVSLSFYSMGVPFILSLLFSLAIGFVLGILTERIFLDKLIGEPVLTVIMVTVGLSFFFKGAVELIWGTDTRVFDPPVFAIEPIRIGPLVIGQVYLWSFIAAIFLISCTSFLEIFWSGSDLGIRHLTAEATKGSSRGHLVGTIDGLGLFGQLIGFLIGF